MAIDYVVDLACVPKQTLGTQGILDRLKARDRAQTVIKLFREGGDQRPPSEMGFEMARSTPDGEEETRVIVVQDMLDMAAELDPLASACEGCPANVLKRPFGCTGFVQYPLSAAGEVWLLKQLPGPEEPLPWLLLRQAVEEMGYTGSSVDELRAGETYFADPKGYLRDLVEFQVSTNQVFEMLFMLGHIQPAHAGVLLLFFNAIDRDMEADGMPEILNRTLSTDDLRARHPFRSGDDPSDDRTIADLKRFFHALYHAWSLNVRLLLDV